MENENSSISKRDENGRFIPGVAQNPTGENGMRGYARYADRANYWMNKLTASELQEIVTNPKNMKDYTIRDWQILIHIARTISGKDIGKERDRLLNRTEGMPVQMIITRNDDAPLPKDIDNASPDEAKRAHDLLIKE